MLIQLSLSCLFFCSSTFQTLSVGCFPDGHLKYRTECESHPLAYLLHGGSVSIINTCGVYSC